MSNVKTLLETVGPVDFEICSIGPVEPFEKKGGGTYDAQEVKIRTRSNGEVYTVRMFPSVVENGLMIGSLVRGSIGSNGYPQWEPLPTGPASANLPQRSNYKQVQAERQMKDMTDTQQRKIDEYRSSEDEKWDRIALSKIVHEFVKVAYASGKPIVDCSLDAKALTREQFRIVEELWGELYHSDT